METILLNSYNVGYSFIKRIKPGETFSYFLIKDTNKTKVTTYSDRIVLIKEKEVEDSLRFRIKDKYLYDYPYILLER